jgi:CheY-like chemotaxis protein
MSVSQLESYLGHSEFQTIVAADPTQAESWITSHSPVAVVINVQSDEDTMWVFLVNLRDRWPALPLIVSGDQADSQRAIAQGASVFLPTPVSRDTLLRELRQAGVQTESRRLLVVDDNEAARYIVRELLARPGLDIAEASNGSDALRAIRQDHPDAVILDLLMPDMSGLEVLWQLRAASSTQTLPVLIYTSKILSEAEKLQLDALGAVVIRKEDVSPRPFLDWLAKAGLSPAESVLKQNV